MEGQEAVPPAGVLGAEPLGLIAYSLRTNATVCADALSRRGFFRQSGFTGGKSRNLHAADGGKDIADALPNGAAGRYCGAAALSFSL